MYGSAAEPPTWALLSGKRKRMDPTTKARSGTSAQNTAGEDQDHGNRAGQGSGRSVGPPGKVDNGKTENVQEKIDG